MTEKPELGELKGVINDVRRIISHVWELLERFERQGELRGGLTITPRDGHIQIDWHVEAPGE